MTPVRLVSIAFIYCCAAAAWFALGASVVHRSGETDSRLGAEVARLWGGQHTQNAPEAFVERERTVVEDVLERDREGHASVRRVSRTVTDKTPIRLDSSDIVVGLKLDQRRKGLLWYSTYGVGFAGRYRLRNPDDAPRTIVVSWAFPSSEALYDAFTFRVNGTESSAGGDPGQGRKTGVTLAPRGEALVELSYRSRGLGAWSYAFAPTGIAEVRAFRLVLTTDFKDIDFPAGTMAPTAKGEEGPWWRLTWEFESLLTGQRVGLDPPRRMNPGPLAARITFFAPVSLLFFVTVLVMLGALRGQSLHPMNYFFLAAAFFSFHLLLAYLVDHLEINAAFLISAATSVGLVVSYLRLVAGLRFAVLEAGLCQFVFLVLFSYAFFFEGYTGLTVTVGAILTLFALMQATGRTDWGQVFRGKSGSPAGAAGR